MKQTELFTKTLKTLPKDEVSRNAQLLIKAGFINKLMAGIYDLLPLGLRVYKKIEHIIREEMNNIGGQEIYMPALHPLENYKKTGRDNIDVLYYTKQRNGAELVLGQSHEEVITPLMKKFISSYKDLPQSVYQFQVKFRNELRAKSGIIRGREFSMKDMYSFHASEAGLENYYKEVQGAYTRIFQRFGLGDLTYLTYASGGTFSKYSHEYQSLTEAGEDVIYICDNCKIAINEEIIKEQTDCPQCGNRDLSRAKSVEVGNIFKLVDKFSRSFNLTYKDKHGREQNVLMGCYGIGLTRSIGTIAEIHNDNKGIIWPQEVAPFKVHLISLGQAEKTGNLYENMVQAGIEVFYDDREEASAGEKFAAADLIGCPFRIVVSEKTIKENRVEIKKRDSDETQLIKMSDVIDWINKK